MTNATKRSGKRAAPRKAARARATRIDGDVTPPPSENGNGAHPKPEADTPYVPPTDVRPPEEFKGPPQHPIYGLQKLYQYQPTDGSPVIDFPHISTVMTDPKFYWKIYQMNEMFQAFEWMNQARVPRDIQERVMDLPDAEKAVFFKEWFASAATPQGVAPPGES